MHTQIKSVILYLKSDFNAILKLSYLQIYIWIWDKHIIIQNSNILLYKFLYSSIILRVKMVIISKRNIYVSKRRSRKTLPRYLIWYFDWLISFIHPDWLLKIQSIPFIMGARHLTAHSYSLTNNNDKKRKKCMIC